MPVPTHDKDNCKTLIFTHFNCKCSKKVYFFVCSCGSKVLFEDLYPYWTKHECNYYIIENAISKYRNQGFNNEEIYNKIINLGSVKNLSITAESEIILQKLLSQFSIDFEIDTNLTESNLTNIGDVQNIDADNLEEIKELENKIINAQPAVMDYITVKIERGGIAEMLKELMSNKCLICEKLYHDPYAYIEPHSFPNVEVHHVIPISSKGIGANSLTNLITLCPNHHKKLHNGDVKTEILYDRFHFHFENRVIEIKKININQ